VSAISQIRKLIEPERDAIVQRLIETAKGGTKEAVRAAEILLDRLAAKPRPTAELVRIEGLAQATTLQAKADAVVLAVARGEVSADAGRAVLQMLDTYSRAIKADELEARLRALEGRPGRVVEAAASPAPVTDAGLVDDAESLV
jgi:hypothetical protein